MSEPATSSLTMRDFGGLVTAVDSLDLPPGTAQVLTNLNCRETGQLMVRRGLAILKFEDDGYVPGT